MLWLRWDDKRSETRTIGHMDDNDLDEEAFQAATRASKARGEVLALFEQLRKDAENIGENGHAWTLALIERMLCAFPDHTPEQAALHNLAVDAINRGVTHHPSAPDAALAYALHAEGLK
jgi:hypothetical protein